MPFMFTKGRFSHNAAKMNIHGNVFLDMGDIREAISLKGHVARKGALFVSNLYKIQSSLLIYIS